MTFPETLAEKDVAQILEQEGMVNETIPVPIYHPNFHEEVNKWRERLFPAGAFLGAVLANSPLFLLAPTYYRLENAYYVGALSVAGGLVGIVMAEAFAYYFADRKT